MRIAFVSSMNGSPWGGSEELWSQTAIRLALNGDSVAAFLLQWDTPPEQWSQILNAGCQIYTRPRYYHVPAFWQRMKHRIAPATKPKHSEYKYLLDWSPDLVVISQGGNCDGLEWMEFCRSNNLRFCTIAHVAWEGYWPDDETANRLYFAMKAAEYCFFVSEGNKNLTEVQIGERICNAEIVRNPFSYPYDLIHPWPESIPEYQLALVGRLDPKSKGHDILFQALAEKGWRDRPVQINLYGRGPCEQGIRRLAQFYDLPNVNFRGFASPVDIWRENHALLLPSRFEGLPLAIVESMMAGRFAIVTDVAGNAELIEDGRTGFVAEAPTAKHFGEVLERAWGQRQYWKQIGVAASQSIRSSISRDPIEDFKKRLQAVVKIDR